MFLFDQISREHGNDAPRYSEPQFDYLNRSIRHEAERIRDTFDRWFGLYSPNDTELRSKFRSSNDDTHRAAVLEVYLHALLAEMEYRVERHVKVNSVSNQNVDFRLRGRGRISIVVEAVTPNVHGPRETAGHRLLNLLLDELAAMQRPGLKLGVELRAFPPATLSIARFRREVQSWLASDTLRAGLNNASLLDTLAHVGKFRWSDGQWGCTVRAYLRSPDRQLATLARVTFGFREDDSVARLQRSLLKKAGKYGSLDAPYIIAVNAPRFWSDQSRAMQALFGKDALVFDADNPGAPAEFTRRPNGLWHGPQGAKFSRVSGVLFVHDLNCWTVGQRSVRLYLNPFAKFPLRGRLLRLPRALPSPNKLRMLFKDGVHPRELLGLSPTWPEAATVSNAA